MAIPPPPFSNIAGTSAIIGKYNQQENLANADGNARPGQLVIDLETDPPTVYIGNNLGNLSLVGGTGNGTIFGSNTWVQYNNNGNFGASSSFTFNSDTNLLSATYLAGDGSNLTNVNLTGAAAGNTTEVQFNLNGNFDASANFRFDTGSNTLYTDQIEIPTGTVLSGVGEVVYVIATLTLNQILANSDGTLAALPAGSYGNPNQVPAPWAVFQFTTDPSPALEVNDILSGTGVPVPSSVTYVGTGGNSNIVVTTSTFYGLPTPLPTFGTQIPVSRQTLNAGLNISTQPNTDIVMTPGPGGGIIWAGNLVPLTNDEFTLGSPTRRIKQSYFGSNTVYIYDNYLGTDQTIGANNGNLIIGGGAGLTVGNFIMSGNTLYLVNSAENFNLGTIGATGNLTVNRRFNVNNSTGEWKLFDINPTGTATLISNVVTGSNIAAMEIIGATTRDINSPNNGGVLLHTSGTSQAPSRIYNDSYGNVANGRYSAYIGRRARGNALAPTGTLNNDIISRIGANPADSSNSFAPISTTRIDFVNSENQTPTTRGGRIEIWNTPVGSPTIALSTSFDTNGVHLIGNTTTTGITFADNTFQNTAFNDTSAVTSVTVGVGLSQTTTVGDVGIDATGVQSITGTANRIIVTDLGGQNFNISAPQDLNTSSTLTFANLTITGNLTVNGTTTTANSANLDNKVLYLAANSTSNSQIDQGGIVLGNNSSSYKVSILYDLPNNAWNTDGANLTTLDFKAANANIDFLNVQNGGHFGLLNEALDYPNAYIQVDSNLNSYSQIVSQNHSSGTQASSDLVLVNDIGDDGNHFIDLGINGSNYTDPAYSSTLANDGYLYMNQGNLVIGTDTAAKTIKFIAGGTTSNDIVLTISNTGLVTPGNAQANYFIGNGRYLTGLPAGNIVGQVANALVAGTVYTNAQPNITSVGTLTQLVVSGNIASGNANLGNVATANYFVGNGYGLTNINVANITGTIANANYAAYAGNVTLAAQSNITSLGTLTGLVVSGNITSGNANLGNLALANYFSGNANALFNIQGANVTGQVAYAAVANSVAGANVTGAVAYATTANSVAGANVSGQVANALVAGTVYTNAQPNITSVGTLSSLSVTGNISGANITGNHYGAGNNLSNIQGGNVSGAVGLATFATTANSVVGANVSGQVSFAATANAVAGANVSGQVSFAATANAVAGANVSGQVGNALIAGTVYTNAQPNITSVGILTGLTSNGVINFTNTSNVTLGAVANLHISGGTSNYVMKTDGTGNLAWIDVNSISNDAPYGDQLVFVNNANVALTGTANTTQSLFGLTNGVTLSSNTRYIYRIVATLAKTGNQDANLNYSLALGVGTVLAQHAYNVQSNENNTRTGISAGVTMMSNNLTTGFNTPVTVSTTSTDTTAFIPIIFEGVIDVTTGGTVNFMITNSKVLTTFTLLALAEITLTPVSAVAANTTVGTWS